MESLVREIMLAIDGLESVHGYGRSGQRQNGIDLVGWRRNEVHVYQVRRVTSLAAAALTKAIEDFAKFPGATDVEGREFNAVRFVLVTGCLTADARVEKELVRLRGLYQGDLDLELYDAAYLSIKLRHFPRLVASYFGASIAEAFCAEVSVTPSQRAVSWSAVLDGPVTDLGLSDALQMAYDTLPTKPLEAAELFSMVASKLDPLYPGHANAVREKEAIACRDAGQLETAFRTYLQLAIVHYETSRPQFELSELERLAKLLGEKERASVSLLTAMRDWERTELDLGNLSLIHI